MKFIMMHTKGPWISRGNEIYTKQYELIGRAFQNSELGVANTKVMAQSTAMLNYMIERAEYLANSIDSYKGIDYDAWPDDCKYEKQELSRLLEIIRACGVEVLKNNGMVFRDRNV